tara:strand:+ start:193 stop:585 length:393 start_codon:yes stop_codon:yes gene_type:complete
VYQKNNLGIRLTTLVQPQPAFPQQPIYIQQAPMINSKSSGLAMVLAFLWPGIDNLYLEDTGMGILKTIGGPILIFMIIGIPVYIIMWVWGMATVSKRTSIYNSNLMNQNQQMVPNQTMMTQGLVQQPPMN